MHNKWYIVILLGLGLLTRFLFFGHPNETVFDEVHFGKFVSGYYTREYFFDIHPPLGKMAIAGFAKLFDFKPGFAFAEIGNQYPDKQYMILRFLPSLAGALLPLIIYLLLKKMRFSSVASFFGGLLIVLENALLTQSHYILMDSFLLLFGFSALYCYMTWKEDKSRQYLLASGILASMSMAVKWTGVSFLAIIILLEMCRLWEDRYGTAKKHLSTILISLLAIPVILYTSVFIIHLKILDRSGTGDAFMSQGFQKTLSGNQAENNNEIEASNIFQKFTELNIEMYKANQRLTATHPYSSPWYTWPFMTRTIYYWVNADSRIYLIGNPVIWWLSIVAILALILNMLRDTKSELKNFIPTFLIAGFVINLLPFMGVKRVMFLYHYFSAYIFAILALVWLIDRQTLNKTGTQTKIICGVILALSVLAFVFFAPLSYGLNLSPEAYESRVWFDSWR